MAQALRNAGFSDVGYVPPQDLDVAGVLAAVDRFRPDVALVNLNLGTERSGLPIIGPLVGRGVAVVAFSARDDDLVIAQCLEAGAVGFLNKAEVFDAVIEYVPRVAAGEHVFPATRREALLAPAARGASRERQAAAGLPRAEPSGGRRPDGAPRGASPSRHRRRAVLSVNTVRSQTESIYRKLGVRSQLTRRGPRPRGGVAAGGVTHPPGRAHRPGWSRTIRNLAR
ncbi:MAG: hypothetical protein M3179_10115 [Actinomycetota bacterium]|nr:hypothetical protein [Actinomycetota bacterium]